MMETRCCNFLEYINDEMFAYLYAVRLRWFISVSILPEFCVPSTSILNDFLSGVKPTTNILEGPKLKKYKRNSTCKKFIGLSLQKYGIVQYLVGIYLEASNFMFGTVRYIRTHIIITKSQFCTTDIKK